MITIASLLVGSSVIFFICKFSGFVTDGEFSSLRTMGKSRPISIVQLISDSRAEARSTPARRIESYLTLGRNGESLCFYFLYHIDKMYVYMYVVGSDDYKLVWFVFSFVPDVNTELLNKGKYN